MPVDTTGERGACLATRHTHDDGASVICDDIVDVVAESRGKARDGAHTYAEAILNDANRILTRLGLHGSFILKREPLVALDHLITGRG